MIVCAEHSMLRCYVLHKPHHLHLVRLCNKRYLAMMACSYLYLNVPLLLHVQKLCTDVSQFVDVAVQC
jgi:hypothetical protein